MKLIARLEGICIPGRWNLRFVFSVDLALTYFNGSKLMPFSTCSVLSLIHSCRIVTSGNRRIRGN